MGVAVEGRIGGIGSNYLQANDFGPHKNELTCTSDQNSNNKTVDTQETSLKCNDAKFKHNFQTIITGMIFFIAFSGAVTPIEAIPTAKNTQ